MDITGDGEWLLIVDHVLPFYIYRYDYEINDFTLFQTIIIGTVKNEAGAITDDHQWLILTKNDGWVYIYTFNETEFVHKETINNRFPGYITYLSITNDHMYIAFIVYQSNCYVYKYNGTNFTLYQNITMSYDNDGGWRMVQLTDDHEFLTVGGGNDTFVSIYQHIGSNFIELTNNSFTHYVRCASFNKDLTYFAVSTDSSTKLFLNATTGNLI